MSNHERAEACCELNTWFDKATGIANLAAALNAAEQRGREAAAVIADERAQRFDESSGGPFDTIASMVLHEMAAIIREGAAT